MQLICYFYKNVYLLNIKHVYYDTIIFLQHLIRLFSLFLGDYIFMKYLLIFL